MSKKKSSSEPMVPNVLRDAIAARLDDQEAKERLPALYDCLMPIYEGSTLVRPGGKLSIFAEGAMWTIKLDLPFEVLVVNYATNQLHQALSDMNEYLASGRAVFRPGYTGKKKKLTVLDKVIE